MTIDVSPAVPADAVEMAVRMRPADALEVRAAGDYEPAEAITASLKISEQAWTVRVDGQIMGIWGVAVLSRLTGLAVPWALTSDVVDHHRKLFVSLSKLLINYLRQNYKLMINMVDARHVSALRWAKRLGFELSEPVKFGHEGRPFVRITMNGDS